MGALQGLVQKTSFSSGEISPALAARGELARYQTGVRKAENVVVMIEGGLTRRPGTQFIWTLKDETRAGLLIPFEFSPDVNYMLVLNAGVMRVMKNGGIVLSGGVPYELAHPYGDGDLDNVVWAQSLDVIFLACKGKVAYTLSRNGDANWAFNVYAAANGPLKAPNLDQAKVISASATTNTVNLVSNFDIFDGGQVGSIWLLEDANLADVPLWTGNETGLSIGTRRRNAGNVYDVVALGGGVGGNAGVNAPVHLVGTVSAGAAAVTWQFLWGAGGYVEIETVTDARHATALVMNLAGGYQGFLPDDVAAGGTFRWSQGAWNSVDGYPEQVILYDDRLDWARGNQHWITRIGDFYDFQVDGTDTSAVALGLTSPDGQYVQTEWMLNLGVIVAGTRSSEWMIRGQQIFDPITPLNVRAVPDGSEGSAPHRPCLVDGGAVFLGRTRQRLHYAEFDRVAEQIHIAELTLYARHILRQMGNAIAYQRDPNRLLWIICQDGSLVSLTFRPDQQVIGWTRHPMPDAVIERIGIINSPNAATQQVWMIVRRAFGPVVRRRYIEVLTDFFEPADAGNPTAAGAWFVDCGLRYTGAPVTTVFAPHLGGATVGVFVNGVEQTRKVVSTDGSGTIHLDWSGTDVIVGLPIEWRVRSLPFDTSGQKGSTKGDYRRSPQVVVECLNSMGGAVSENDGPATTLFPLGGEVTGVPMTLRNGLQRVDVLTDLAQRSEVEISGDNAYPFTLLALSPNLDFQEA